jgi:hypothetical protein
MINKDTPDKLAEIIRDTWPGLFTRPEKDKKELSPADKKKIKDERGPL